MGNKTETNLFQMIRAKMLKYYLKIKILAKISKCHEPLPGFENNIKISAFQQLNY